MGRKLAVMAISLFALGAFGTASASAAGSANCALTPGGVAGNISPGVGLTAFTGGSYTFAGGATCVYNNSPVAANIVSNGNFNNTICGTGTVYNGYARISASGLQDIEATYGIEFRASVGHLTVIAVNDHNTAAGWQPAKTGSTGVVQIAPKTGNCSSGITEFYVNGAFRAEW